MTYAEKLTDPRWQRKRLEIFQRDKFRCRCCGHEDRTLCVHHRWYLNGADPWDYDNEALLTLCEDCHEAVKHNCEQAKSDLDFMFLLSVLQRLIEERGKIRIMQALVWMLPPDSSVWQRISILETRTWVSRSIGLDYEI